MSEQKNIRPSSHTCLDTINKIADRLETRKRLASIAESMCNQEDCTVQCSNLLQSETDIYRICYPGNSGIGHECRMLGFGCNANHGRDGNFRCGAQHACPSQLSYDCSGFSCRGPENGNSGVGTSSFDCNTQQSFLCGGMTFVCTHSHQCGGSASQQANRDFSCTNNVRCHAGNTGNNGFGCGGTNSSASFQCGVPGGTDNNVFDCQYGFKCSANAAFTCEQKTSFKCQSNPNRDGFQCNPKSTGGASYTCKQNVDCPGTGAASFDCAATGGSHSCSKTATPSFNCGNQAAYNDCARYNNPNYDCTATNASYGG